MINIAICDDDQVTAEELGRILYKVEACAGEEISIRTYLSGEKLAAALEAGVKYHMIFLDIAMPEMNGVTVGEKIRNELGDNDTEIIYISSQTNYAMQLFKIRPLDFVVKPFREEDIKQTFLKGCELIRMSKRMFTFKIGRRQEIVRRPISDILYFYSHGRKVTMVCEKDNLEFYGSLKEIEEELGPYRFFFVHRSYLVNYRHVERMTYSNVTLTNGETFEISQLKRKGVRELCDAYER